MMNVEQKKLAAACWLACGLLAGAPALAAGEADDQGWPVDPMPPKTRAQVLAELQQARADGSLDVMSSAYDPFKHMRSLKTRAQVRDELARARASGEIAAALGEPHAFSVEPARDSRVATTLAAGAGRP